MKFCKFLLLDGLERKFTPKFILIFRANDTIQTLNKHTIFTYPLCEQRVVVAIGNWYGASYVYYFSTHKKLT